MNKRLKRHIYYQAINSYRSASLLHKSAANSPDRRPQRIVKHCLSLRYQLAFSLVELLVTTALIGILATIAAPSIQQMQQYYERVKAERITQQLLQEGRNIAFSLRQRIIICASETGQQCTPNRWQKGMLMFHDVNLDNIYTAEVDQVVRFEPLNLKYGTWQWIGGAKFTSFVRFEHTSGMPHASFGSFHYCDFEQQHPFKLVMRNTGVLRKDSKDVSC